MTIEIQEALKATSNVIELKPGHKYLLVFKGSMVSADLAYIGKVLKAQGIDSLSLALQDEDELQVIEVSA